MNGGGTRNVKSSQNEFEADMAYLDQVASPNNKHDIDIFGGGEHVTNRQGYVRKAQPQQQY